MTGPGGGFHGNGSGPLHSGSEAWPPVTRKVARLRLAACGDVNCNTGTALSFTLLPPLAQ